MTRELTRVVTTETEQAWIDAAEHKTVREVERMVSGRQAGDRPEDPVDDHVRRHVVRFEANAETLALLREAQSALVRQTGHHLDDDEVVQLLARQVLGGPNPHAGESRSERKPPIPPVGNSREQRRPESPQRRATQTIPPAIRRAVIRRHGGRCAVPGCRHRIFVDVHHMDRRADGGDHNPDRLIVLCGAHHVAEHRGRLLIEGRASTGFRFHHADGRQ